MGRQLRTEQVSVAPGDRQSAPLALQAVDEKLPAGQILDFIQKQVRRLPVQGVQGGYQVVVVLEARQPLVIEVDVPKTPLTPNRVERIERLARSPGPHDDV